MAFHPNIGSFADVLCPLLDLVKVFDRPRRSSEQA